LAEYATFDFCLKAGAVVYVILCVIWLDVHRNASWFTWCVAIIWPVTKSPMYAAPPSFGIVMTDRPMKIAPNMLPCAPCIPEERLGVLSFGVMGTWYRRLMAPCKMEEPSHRYGRGRC
jgi:hypothetical protein